VTDFDPTKNQVLAEVGYLEPSQGKMGIVVEIVSYDGEFPKVSVSRRGTKKDGAYFFGRLGRLTADEARRLCPLLESAAIYIITDFGSESP